MNVGGTPQLRQPPVPQREQVLCGQGAPQQVIVSAGGQANAGYVLEGQYHGDSMALDPAEDADVSDPPSRQDDGINSPAQQVIEDPLQARGIILRFSEQRHESCWLQSVRDPSEYRGDRWIAEVGDDGGDSLGPTLLQPTGHHVRLVAHFLCDRLDAFASVDAHAPNGGRIECAGNRRVVHAGGASDILQGHDRSSPARVAFPHSVAPALHAQAPAASSNVNRWVHLSV